MTGIWREKNHSLRNLIITAALVATLIFFAIIIKDEPVAALAAVVTEDPNN